jgi:hypothetical protein
MPATKGRLVNIHSFSVNTIASVLKQFLRKIPGGIFGRENEAILFTLVSILLNFSLKPLRSGKR